MAKNIHNKLNDFRDQKNKASIIIFILYSFIALHLVNIILQCCMHGMYKVVLEHEFFDLVQNDIVSEKSGLNILLLLIGFLDSVFMIGMIIVFSMWMYRNNKNARALGVANLKFSPCLTFISYAIPIFSLWWPYKAMKEIWIIGRYSTQEDHSSLSYSTLRWWWFLWLISCYLGHFNIIVSSKIETKTSLDFFLGLTILETIWSLLSIFKDILLILIVKRINTTLHEQFKA